MLTTAAPEKAVMVRLKVTGWQRLCFAVCVTAMWRTSRGLTGAGSRLADLAVGQERTVEARLTGGFRSFACAARSGGSSVTTDNWTLYGRRQAP